MIKINKIIIMSLVSLIIIGTIPTKAEELNIKPNLDTKMESLDSKTDIKNKIIDIKNKTDIKTIEQYKIADQVELISYNNYDISEVKAREERRKDIEKKIIEIKQEQEEKLRLEEEERLRQEEERLKQEEEIRLQEEARKKEEERLKLETEKGSFNIDFILTYYGPSASENGGYEGINCKGKKLQEGQVASNYYPLGTKIKLEDGTQYVVADRGGSDFNSPNRLDVFVNTNSKEVLFQLGRKSVKGKIIK